MHVRKKERAFSVFEAVDNLSLFAELDSSMQTSKKEFEAFESASLEHISKRSWQDPNALSLNIQKARQTFEILLSYLKNLYENEEEKLRETPLQKGIQAMMLLAMEAASNLENYLEPVIEEKVTQWEEYKALLQFYQSVIAPKLQHKLELVEQWQEEWGIGAQSEKSAGIEDLEMVRRDLDYELFQIRREDERAFFNRALFRHIHLVKQFDELITLSVEEDPLSKLNFVKDSQMHHMAKGILEAIHLKVDDFYKRCMEHKSQNLVATMNKMLMALMLAANPRNTLQTASGKSSLNYFADFHYFFRTLLFSKEYHHLLISPPPPSEKLAHSVMELAQALATAFFTQKIASEQVSSLLKMLRESGMEGFDLQSESKSPLSLWNVLLDEDEEMRFALKNSSFGPLNKTLTLFKNSERRAFDPLMQGNLPHELFTLSLAGEKRKFLYLPCPTIQSTIKKAQIAPEFLLFLRALKENKKRHLLINLQDRTSWQEQARCHVLEELDREYDSLTVVTLSTRSDFYLQGGKFAEVEEAEEFIQAFIAEVEEGKTFFFPPEISYRSFLHKTLRAIHMNFFAGKRLLPLKNRLDFIEIFYLFLSLKCMEQIQPDSVSFTSKDSIDSAAAKNAEMYAFFALAQNQSAWSEEDKEFFRILLYAPAILIRERGIDAYSLKRALSALCILNSEPARLKPLLAA